MTTPAGESPASHPRADGFLPLLALGVLSAATLGLEVFITKVLAYSVPIVLVYVVLGIALLGFGAAGSLVSLRSGWLQRERLPAALAWSSLGFVFTLIFSIALFARLTRGVTEPNFEALAVAALLTLPFFSAGVVVALALSAAGAHPGRTYAANLVGSGLGCFLPLAVLGPIDGEHFLAIVAVLGWFSALLYVLHSGRKLSSPLGAATAIALVAAVGCYPFASRVFDFQPSKESEVAFFERVSKEAGVKMETVYDRWDPIGRIQIFSFSNVPGWGKRYPFLFWVQDAAAPSTVFSWNGFTKSHMGPDQPKDFMPWVPGLCSATLYGEGYILPRKRVLVIGMGGAPDVQCAIYHEAADIDVVEINSAALHAIVGGPLDEFTGGIGHHPHVTYHLRDGRSFAHGATKKYDLIELTGADAKASLGPSGSLALNENQLYTLEAMRDYLRILTPTGVLSILRFAEEAAVRLVNMAVIALQDRGVRDPRKHIIVLKDDVFYGVMVSPTPFSPAAVAKIRRWVVEATPSGFGLFDFTGARASHENRRALFLPGVVPEKPSIIHAYFEHLMAGTLESVFEEHYEWDISPVFDDRPYFFDQFRYDRPDWTEQAHVKAIARILAAVLVLSVIFILLPIWSIGKGSHRLGRALALLFFSSVGLGFLLVEVWLIHHFTMFLGHHTYALAVVLAVLLVGSGIGAMVGERVAPMPRRRVLIGVSAIFLLLVFGYFALPPIQEAAWGTGMVVRTLVAAAYIGALGFFMGFPFPSGLRWAAGAIPRALPWCVGINSFASVLASLIVIPITVSSGYTAVLLVGAAFYGSALLASLAMRAGAGSAEPT